mmetsp:Transcript_2757/g.4124  ORF Transcript_2757/g.4124 Transcript_2757/m.4124 type:complete len:498 (+) Transcript_2757:207-1700(+)
MQRNVHNRRMNDQTYGSGNVHSNSDSSLSMSNHSNSWNSSENRRSKCSTKNHATDSSLDKVKRQAQIASANRLAQPKHFKEPKSISPDNKHSCNAALTSRKREPKSISPDNKRCSNAAIMGRKKNVNKNISPTNKVKTPPSKNSPIKEQSPPKSPSKWSRDRNDPNRFGKPSKQFKAHIEPSCNKKDETVFEKPSPRGKIPTPSSLNKISPRIRHENLLPSDFNNIMSKVIRVKDEHADVGPIDEITPEEQEKMNKKLSTESENNDSSGVTLEDEEGKKIAKDVFKLYRKRMHSNKSINEKATEEADSESKNEIRSGASEKLSEKASDFKSRQFMANAPESAVEEIKYVDNVEEMFSAMTFDDEKRSKCFSNKSNHEDVGISPVDAKIIINEHELDENLSVDSTICDGYLREVMNITRDGTMAEKLELLRIFLENKLGDEKLIDTYQFVKSHADMWTNPHRAVELVRFMGQQHGHLVLVIQQLVYFETIFINSDNVI